MSFVLGAKNIERRLSNSRPTIVGREGTVEPEFFMFGYLFNRIGQTINGF